MLSPKHLLGHFPSILQDAMLKHEDEETQPHPCYHPTVSVTGNLTYKIEKPMLREGYHYQSHPCLIQSPGTAGRNPRLGRSGRECVFPLSVL